MTDADTPVPPGGGPSADGATALEVFDQHGSAVFAALCRVSVGDRRLALDTTTATFRTVDPARASSPGGRIVLVVAAMRALLADLRADDDWIGPDGPGVELGTDVDEGAQPQWSALRWGRTADTLRALTTVERIALDLSLNEGGSTVDVAAATGCSPADVGGIVAVATGSLRDDASLVDPAALLRSAELWLGDDERAAIRTSLGAPDTAAGPPHEDSDRSERTRRGRDPRTLAGAAVGLAVVAVLSAIGVLWVQSLPTRDATQPVDTIAVSTSTADLTTDPSVAGAPLVAVPQADGVVTEIQVTPITGALREADLFVMASGLDHPAVVVPEHIVRYSDGKVGLSWRSPCNRPAIGVALTATTTGAVIELTTGEFPIRSCLGMPDRWTAVVRPSQPLPEGEIRPIAAGGQTVPDWDGLIESDGSAGGADELFDDASSGSALVDAANQPWVYGLGCSSRSARYLSPVGAIFEIRRAETIDPNSYSSSDAIVCADLAGRQVLTGPLGATFPNAAAEPGARPRDCPGPAGSLIDVPAKRPFTDRFYDGEWSTWDGCLVRADVVFSESMFETCAGHDVRTITFAAELGRSIDADTPIVRYLRDPDGVVAASLDPFRAYQVPSSDVHDTGLRFGDQQLWVSNETDLAIYVRNGRTIERWPRFDGAVSCTSVVAAG